MDTKKARLSAGITAGITNGRVFRSAEDPNDVVILQDVADVAKARTWFSSDEVKAGMQKGGVVGSPNFRFSAAAEAVAETTAAGTARSESASSRRRPEDGSLSPPSPRLRLGLSITFEVRNV